MTDSRSEIERAAAALAEGQELDWAELALRLSPAELAALRVLDEAQLRAPDLQGIEQGFELRGELGRGSMGRVERAYDRSLAREVALKVITPERGLRPDARANFVAEARLLASIRHPGIVQVHSIHEQEGEIRMVLELVEGRTLEDLLAADGPLSCAEAARIGGNVCRALAVLHGRGITHRDLKPANLMRETGGRIVLLDFGIARSPSSSVPLASGAAGTPRFMAPEQFGHGSVGPHTDLWALGALLYWLVSARFPFEGQRFEDLRRAVLTTRAIPLVDRRGDVDPRFAAVVERALAREPGERFRTAGELEQALRSLTTDEADARAQEAQASTSARMRLGPLGAALIVLALGLAAGLWARGRTGPTPLHLDAELYARRGANDVRLRDGDAIGTGDLLLLEASAAEPFHLYVFDQDDAGEQYVLFPVPGFEPANPLGAGARHRLPGKLNGETQCWEVTSGGGGGETVLVVAAREPIAAMEELLASIPPVQPGRAASYPLLPAPTCAALLRGIGSTARDPQLSTAPSEGTAQAALDVGALLQALDPAPGYAIRVVRLRNR